MIHCNADRSGACKTTRGFRLPDMRVTPHSMDRHYRRRLALIDDPPRWSGLLYKANLKKTKITMPKNIQEQHTKAAEECKNAAKHHEQAAVHVAAGEHEAGAHHAQCAQGHQTTAKQHADHAATLHGAQHGHK